jgi:diguanylate cyclase (GGDEF)-like protein/PAS domain S-box-containing protein
VRNFEVYFLKVLLACFKGRLDIFSTPIYSALSDANMLNKILNSRWFAQRQVDAWLPWIFLFVALPITFLIWKHEKDRAFTEQEIRFEYHAKEATNLINRQLMQYGHVLEGMQSFFRASIFVDEHEFSDYVSALLQPNRLSGLRSVAFAKYIDSTRPETYARLNTDWHALTQKILPKEVRTFYAPIIYAAPQSSLLLVSPQSNTLLDVLGEAPIRQEFQRSADLNNVIVSPVMQSIQGNQLNDYFLMHLPIYENNTINNNVTQRRMHIDGWVLATINGELFFTEAIQPAETGLLKYALYDVTANQQNKPIYTTKHAQFHAKNAQATFARNYSIKAMGYEWQMRAESLPTFEKSLDYKRANYIGLLGLLISFALSGILYLLVARTRATDTIHKVSSQLSASEQRWQFALEGAGDGVWDWDVKTNKMIFSKRWKAMLGFTESEIGDDVDEWKKRIYPEDYVSVMQAVQATLAGLNPSYSNEHRMQCKDGSWKWILDRGMVVSHDAEGKPERMVGTHADISSLKKSEEVIWQQANFDLLTGLPNRRMFYDRLDQELQKAKRSGLKVALIFLDLDGFKEVNDTLGHDQGDFLLKLTANRLVDCMRGSDAVARLGGDEFVLMVADVGQSDLNHVEIIAQKVLEVLSEPFQLGHEVAYISASLGIAIFPDDASNTENLMKSVDQAMYASKQKGGRCFTYFTARMQQVAQHRMQLSNDLRLALLQNQLYVEYQPIIELKTGRVHKAEALVRWQHPTRGYVSPAEFIPIAENTRLIQDIGNWVFNEAFKQVSIWRQTLESNFQVAVNKSPIQFTHEEDKAHCWEAIVQENPTMGKAIVVEITEGLLLDASAEVVQRLKTFQQMGMQVALDDFGTGYSSLSYLKKFEIDYLKIDQSFVANLSEGSDDLILCEAIIMMAHRLGMKVVAEGIETAQQKTLLVRAGCDYGQGFLFSKSLLPKDLEAYAILHNQTVFTQ